MGIIKIISMSKIRKIRAILKNRREKGLRLKLKGSNPHSNGLDFSLSENLFFLKMKAHIMTVRLSRGPKINFIILFKINFLIGS